MRDCLDLDRYPLDRPGQAAWQALVARCRADLEAQGMFNLEGLMPRAVAEADARKLAPKFAREAFRHERVHNIYFLKSVDGLPPDHPALTEFRTSNDTLCEDQLSGTAISRLYRWPDFAVFLAAVMRREALYPMGDPLAGLNAMSYAQGQSLNWHFDRSEFTTTMLLQAPERGGEFIYRTDLRQEGAPNYDGVARLLRGEDEEVKRLTLAPGTLNVFRGKNTPHRVGDVAGERARVIAVFSFYDRPGVAFSEDERIGFYGRAG